MQIIDGKAHALRLRADIAQAVIARQSAGARAPALAVVLVGEDPASQVYVHNKIAACAEAGITSIEHRRDTRLTEADLLALVDALNRDPAVDGILVQLPLPPQIDSARVIAAIDPDKDVD
ncbi:MAG: tetrahydrofolate dehydrogenase/cyclohydrolase catalytic domain-containing protein, partial [Sandaracinobacter sp.]